MRKYCLALVLFLLPGVCLAAVGVSFLVNWTHPLNKRLVGWWRGIPGVVGGQTFLDIANGNDFILQNFGYSSTSGWSPSTGTGGYMRVNFDGVDDWGTAGAPLVLGNLNEKTICLWLQIASFGATPRSRILDKQGASGVGGWVWMVNNIDVPNGFVYSHDFSGTQGSWGWSSVLSLNTRTHVCLAYDRTAAANLPVMYVNGLSVGTGAILTSASGTATVDAGTSLYIADRVANDRQLQGSIEDLRMWDVMLGPKDIQRIYQNSLAGSPGLLWTPESMAVVDQTAGAVIPSLLPFLRPLRPH